MKSGDIVKASKNIIESPRTEYELAVKGEKLLYEGFSHMHNEYPHIVSKLGYREMTFRASRDEIEPV